MENGTERAITPVIPRTSDIVDALDMMHRRILVECRSKPAGITVVASHVKFCGIILQ